VDDLPRIESNFAAPQHDSKYSDAMAHCKHFLLRCSKNREPRLDAPQVLPSDSADEYNPPFR
jgi:hypothetical protein